MLCHNKCERSVEKGKRTLPLAIKSLRRESPNWCDLEAVPWNFWYRENQVADLHSIIDIILHLRAGRIFSEVVSTRSSGASRGRFSTASFVHSPVSTSSFLWEKRSPRPTEPVAKFFATFVISSSAILRACSSVSLLTLQSASGNFFRLLEHNNNVGTSTLTSELDHKLVVRHGMLSQQHTFASFLPCRGRRAGMRRHC